MALYREGKAAMAADGTVTGTGTKWQSSLSLIRPGATIMFLSSPIQMAVVNKVVSDTEIKAITTKGAVVASTDYAILLSDSLTVDGLAQDVAETLRYYQSQETVIADAVEFFKEFDFESLQNLANQIKADSEAAESSAAAAAASESKAKTSEDNAKSSENAAKNSEVSAETTRDQIQQIIDNAGDQSTLVVLAQPDGASKSGWKRDPLHAAIKTQTVSAALSALRISVWEFAHHITDKPDASDPNTWDWSPAIQAAFDYIGTYVSLTINGNTRYASAGLDFPPGYYRCSSQVIADYSSYSGYVYGRPRLTITGYGASIGCGVEQDFTWKVIGTLLNMCGPDFIADSTVNYSYAMKLGDETKTTSNYAVTGVLRDVRGFNLTKFVTFGWAFDMRIEGPYATGFKQDPNVTEPATYFEILEHVSDNCNHLVFIRPQGETANTKNFEYFRINGNSHLSTHHNIHMFGGHFESHQYGIKFVNAVKNASGRPAVHQCSFNGVVFLENESNDAALNALTPAASTHMLELDQASCIELNCCRVATTNTTTEDFDSSKHKALIKYSGSSLSLVIRGGYFVTAFASVAGSNQNRYTLIDISDHQAGKRAVEFSGRYSMNNFSTAHSTGRVLSGWVSGNRKWIEEVSDDGLEYSWSYSTSSNLTGTPTKMFSIDSTGTFSVNDVKASGISVDTVDVSTSFSIGYKNTKPGSRSVDFYGAGTTELTGQVYGNPAGSITVKSTNNIFLSPNGGAGETQATGNIKPTVAASYNIGTASLPWKDGFFQNAITVVSDEDHKPVKDAIPDAVLDIFDSLEIKRWKYDWAIAEKGEDNARWHVGFIAQEIIEAFSNAGLDAQDYAFLVWREWDAEPAQYEQVLVRDAVTDPETGEVISEPVFESRIVSDAINAGARWELVTHEINFILAACQERRIKRLELLLGKQID